MLWGPDPKEVAKAIAHFCLFIILFFVVTYLCWPVANLWLKIFPLIDAETVWGSLYNLFVCAGFSGCFFLPLIVVWLVQRTRNRQQIKQ
jgi:ABC-type sulfate transport system permease component